MTAFTSLPTDVETWEIDGLVLGDMADGCYYEVHTVRGWNNGPAPRSARAPRPAAHGAYRAANWRSEKVVGFDGVAVAPDEPTARRAADRLAALCYDPHVLFPLRHVDTRSGEDLTLYVEMDDEPLININYGTRPIEVSFSLQFAAPDPYRYASGFKTASTGLAQDAPGGIQWGGPTGSTGVQWGGPAGSTGVVWQTGVGVTGVITLDNEGTADASVVFTISGPVTTPYLVDQTFGGRIEYTGSVGTGQNLVIDTGTGSVRLDGADRSYLVSRFDPFTIPAHSSIEVAFRSPLASPTAQLTAVWRDAYI